jgi:hypothetical protein
VVTGPTFYTTVSERVYITTSSGKDVKWRLSGRLRLPAIARPISWGLMHVMGQVAREHGFAAMFLSVLCNSEIGLETGCFVLIAILSKAGDDVPRAPTLWNGGRNADYPYEVLARVTKYR